MREALLVVCAAAVAALAASWLVRRWAPRAGGHLSVAGHLAIRFCAAAVLVATTATAAAHGGWWILVAVLCGVLALSSAVIGVAMLVLWLRGDVSENG